MSELIAAYLFLGGVGAGMFICTELIMIVSVCHCEKERSSTANFFRSFFVCDGRVVSGRGLCSFEKRAKGVSLAAIMGGSLFLVCDLGLPENLLSLFFSPTATYITLGAWALIGLVVCEGTLLAVGDRRSRFILFIRVLAIAIGIILALYIMVYTGMVLFGAIGVDLWHSEMLPILFLISSATAGYAAVVLCGKPFDWGFHWQKNNTRIMVLTDLALILLELIAVILYLYSVSLSVAGQSALETLFSGNNALLFFGVFGGLGIAVPLILDMIMLRNRAQSLTVMISTFATLVGAFSLRVVLVNAGINVFF